MKLEVVLSAAAALLVSGLAASVALGHVGATGIVKERMDAMSAISDANKALAAMFKGEVDYDAAEVERAAMIINGHAGEAMTRLFPEGSDGMPSEALPTIWADWAAFERLADDLAVYSRSLADAADNPRGASGENGMMGQDMMGTGMMGPDMMGQGTMMGGEMMSSGRPDAAMLASMPPDASYMQLNETCSACHTKFRMEDE